MPRSCPKSLSNCRRAQTQALDKQLIGVEELVVESQERCAKALVELREVLEIGGVARATDPHQETLVTATFESILVLCLALVFLCQLVRSIFMETSPSDFDPCSSNP